MQESEKRKNKTKREDIALVRFLTCSAVPFLRYSCKRYGWVVQMNLRGDVYEMTRQQKNERTVRRGRGGLEREHTSQGHPLSVAPQQFGRPWGTTHQCTAGTLAAYML